MSEETRIYIKKYFRLEFLTSYDSLNEDELNKIVTGIGNLLSRKYKTKDIVNGKADRIIYKTIDETLKVSMPHVYSSKVNLKRYIKNYIGSNFFVNYSDKTLNYIAERITFQVEPDVDYIRLMNGDVQLDNKISTYYKTMYEDTLTRVRNYVKNYLIRNVYPMIDIDEIAISNEFVKQIMEDNKYNVVDLFTRKYDKMIEQMAYNNRRKNQDMKPDAYRYIKSYIIKLDECLEFEEINNLALTMEESLRDEGYNSSNIVGHLCDARIEKMYNYYIMKSNSVYDEKKPKRVKHKINSKKMQKGISTLLIIASLTGVVGGGIYMVGKGAYDAFVDLSVDITYNSTSSVMSVGKYEYLFTKYNDGYLINMDNAVEDYNNYSKLGEVYGYLGIYETYKHVEVDSLAIMDSFIEDLDYKIFNGEYDTDMKISAGCFLEFVYDRLVDMGCEEIQQEKYLNAIREYNRASVKNDDQNKTTMDYIQKEDSKLVKVISEIMQMYHEYSAKCYKELSEVYAVPDSKGRS